MRRVYWAIAVLAVLFTGIIINTFTINNHIKEIESHVYASYKYVLEDDTDSALSELNTAQEIWSSSEKYRHLIMHREDSELITDAFFEAEMHLDESGQTVLEQLMQALEEVRHEEIMLE